MDRTYCSDLSIPPRLTCIGACADRCGFKNGTKMIDWSNSSKQKSELDLLAAEMNKDFGECPPCVSSALRLIR